MDKALKQRLVGASVLIALAVIVLPMLLGGKPEGAVQQSQKIELPPRPEELNFETRRFPLGNNPGAGETDTSDSSPTISRLPAPSATMTQPIPQVEQQSQTPGAAAAEPTGDNTESPGVAAGAAPDQPDLESADSSPVAEPAVVAPSVVNNSAAPSGGRYLVQVASLGSDDNARRLMSRLQQKGFSVLLDTVSTDVGRLNRVRVGPFQQESEANSAVSRIRRDVDGVNPRVIDISPDQAAAMTAPSDPLVRWVVQVGSFGEQSNADNLVTMLRESGLTAYREARSSGSSTIFRVRVGPFLERDEAMRIKQQLLQDKSIDGVVMSAD